MRRIGIVSCSDCKIRRFQVSSLKSAPGNVYTGFQTWQEYPWSALMFQYSGLVLLALGTARVSSGKDPQRPSTGNSGIRLVLFQYRRMDLPIRAFHSLEWSIYRMLHAAPGSGPCVRGFAGTASCSTRSPQVDQDSKTRTGSH